MEKKNPVCMINSCLNNISFYGINIGLCMHEISKQFVVALHFTCMGTSCISGVSARHDFKQVVFIGWLSNKILSEYVLHSTIRVCPNEIY